MSAREAMQALVDKWRKDADNAPRSQSNEERGYSNALHDAADELAALLVSPALPRLMSAAKKEGGEADNIQPDMEALRRENEQMRSALRAARDVLEYYGEHASKYGDADYPTDEIAAIDAAIAAQAGKQGGG